MASIDYNSRIPNNVDLDSDRRLQRALERWQPDGDGRAPQQPPQHLASIEALH